MNLDHYRTLVGPCDEFTITHDLARQITTIFIRRGERAARQVLTEVQINQALDHVDLIAHTIKRMVHHLTPPPPMVQDVSLTFEEYYTQFHHLADTPTDLVGKTLIPPLFAARVRVLEVDVTHDRVNAKVEVLPSPSARSFDVTPLNSPFIEKVTL